jgi:hypothetical protein
VTYTIRNYFERLKAVEESLPPGEVVFLVSIDNPACRQVGGQVVSVNRGIAARSIDAGSHRLATDEEAAAHQAGQEESRERARRARIMPTVSYRGEVVVLEPLASDGPKKKAR